MAIQFPWMLALSVEDQETCASELDDTARALFATNQAYLAIAEVNAWHETATAIASDMGQTAVDWFESDIKVERP